MIEHDIWLESELDAPFPYEAFLRQCITKALELEQVTLPCEINVLITDNEGIHRINLEQRQVDAPTDVLSFPMFDLTAMGFLVGQCCGRWGNFFNQEAFGCNTTLPWGMYSEGTRSYLMGSTVTVQNGVTIDPNLPVHPTFLYESIWCLVGFILLFRYIKKRKFNGDITLRYLIWYGAGRFWIEALRTDSLMLVPSIGLRVSQLLAGIAVVAGVAAEIYFTRKFKGKPLMVPLAMTAENKAAMKKLDGPIAFAGADTQLPASASRKEFVEKTERYNAEVKQKLEEQQKNH